MERERRQAIQFHPFHPTLTHHVKLSSHSNGPFFAWNAVLVLIFGRRELN